MFSGLSEKSAHAMQLLCFVFIFPVQTNKQLIKLLHCYPTIYLYITSFYCLTIYHKQPLRRTWRSPFLCRYFFHPKRESLVRSLTTAYLALFLLSVIFSFLDLAFGSEKKKLAVVSSGTWKWFQGFTFKTIGWIDFHNCVFQITLDRKVEPQKRSRMWGPRVGRIEKHPSLKL